MPTASRSAVRRVTTTEGAVLALLAIEGERSPYELAKQVERSIGHVWAPARSGLFAALPRLAKNGLVEARRAGAKQVYRLAQPGREALAAWLEGVEPGARDTFFLKLFVGGLTTPDVLLEHVEQFRVDTEARLAVLRELEPSNTNRDHDWFHRRLLEYGIARAELELAWVDDVAHMLRTR
jgi:DNA-binding PadR family transcriptional regulator